MHRKYVIRIRVLQEIIHAVKLVLHQPRICRHKRQMNLPARKSALDDMVEKALNVTYMTDENGEQILDENGNPIPEGGTSSISYGDWEYSYHIPTQEEVAVLQDLINVAEPSSATGNDEITNIITEEAEAFFKGQKSVSDVANVIQSRVQVYVNENR